MSGLSQKQKGFAHRLEEVRIREVIQEGANPIPEGLVEDVEGWEKQHDTQVAKGNPHQGLFARRVHLLRRPVLWSSCNTSNSVHCRL